LPVARLFRHGELGLVVLALLEREAMHGYQVLAALALLTGPTYVPSAGSVYPAIRGLRDEGLIGATAAGRKSVYSLTDLGHRALRARGEELAAFEARTGLPVRSATSVDAEIDRFAARIRALRSLVPAEAVSNVLDVAALQLEAAAREWAARPGMTEASDRRAVEQP
jgi:DNA-binding PadR family transcriptional regulator